MLVFIVVPLALAFVISRQAGAQQIRRKAIAKSYNWAVENKNEGQLAWILRGFHRDVPFEAVALLREGGGAAWRVRMPVICPILLSGITGAARSMPCSRGCGWLMARRR